MSYEVAVCLGAVCWVHVHARAFTYVRVVWRGSVVLGAQQTTGKCGGKSLDFKFHYACVLVAYFT